MSLKLSDYVCCRLPPTLEQDVTRDDLSPSPACRSATRCHLFGSVSSNAEAGDPRYGTLDGKRPPRNQGFRLVCRRRARIICNSYGLHSVQNPPRQLLVKLALWMFALLGAALTLLSLLSLLSLLPGR